MAVERALLFFALQISNCTVAVFADNSTAIACLRNQGGTRSQVLSSISQRILRWAESLPVVLAPQFIMGRNNVIADSLSRPNQILGSEWTLKAEVFQDLQKRWPVSIDLFATSLNHQCCPFFFFSVPRSERSGHGYSAPELISHTGSSEEAPVVIWSPPDHHSSLLATETVVSGPSGSGGGRSGSSAAVSRPPTTATLPSSSSRSVRAVTSCMETIQRFARSQGFSTHVAKQSSLARRSSYRAGYQAKWSIYRQWCRSEGHSISRPSLPKVADFLFWLRRSKKLLVSAVVGYHSVLSAVFRSQLPEISISPVIQDLMCSFKVEAPCCSISPPSWDLMKVLDYL